ncbi:MAG: hypothetical protein ACF8QF_10490 [Phycisphaerales bacterium]
MNARQARRVFMSLTAVLVLTPLSLLAQSGPPSDPEAERIVDAFVTATGHSPELYHERRAAVRAAPERFVPILRERLSQIPATLDEYDPDDRACILNGHLNPRSGSQAATLLGIVGLLPLVDAEPILQEFFDKVNPLAVEAERRYWRERDIANAAGRKTGRELVDTKEVYLALSGARGQAIKVAKNLDSDIFHDDFLAMLASDDPVAQETGANYTRGNLEAIVERNPEALAQIVDATSRLGASDDPRVAKAGRTLMEAVRQTLQSPPRDNTPADPARQREP